MNSLALSCTLERHLEVLETETFALIELDELSSDGVETEMIWAIDRNMLPGTHSFEDEGVEWQELGKPLLQSRVFVIGRPA